MKQKLKWVSDGVLENKSKSTCFQSKMNFYFRLKFFFLTQYGEEGVRNKTMMRVG